MKLEVGVIAKIDKEFPMFDPSLPRKPLVSLTVGQAREKIVLNTNSLEVATSG